MNSDYFDKDYFTNGEQAHKSGYDKDTFRVDNDTFKKQAVMLNDILKLSGKKVIDIGCARNNLAYWLNKLGVDACGLDISQWCYANSHLPEKHFCIDICEWTNILKETYDVVVSFEVFEHFENPHRAIGEIKRILKPNGILFATIGAGDHKNDVSAVSIYNRNWWISTLGSRFTNVLPDLENKFLEHELVKAYKWTPYCYQK